MDFVPRELQNAARRIPGVSRLEDQARTGGQFLMKEVNRRLGPTEPRALPQPAPIAVAADDPTMVTEAEASALGEQMRALMKRSVQHSPAESRRTLHQALVDELLPDEARILSALSDGTTYPLIHVAEPGLVGTKERVLENASSVGRAAGVALPERVPFYLSHLRRLGLVESGPEEPSLRDEYELLLTDPQLRATIGAFGKGPRGARIIRRTVRIADLGRELWVAAHGSAP